MKLQRIFWVSLLLAVSHFSSFAAGTPTDWNLTVLDHLLGAAPAGQRLVPVGDMLLPRAYLQRWRNALAGGPQAKLAFDGTFTPWTGGNVYYEFSNNVAGVKQKAFQDGMAEWAMFANLHFIPHTTEPNYVTIFEAPSLEGGQSMVGMVGGQQFLQIGPTAWNRATICHELGHTLGLIHEQQRSDRDSYVTIQTANIAAGEEGNFVILTDSLNQSPYDFLSVMHYARNAFSVDPSLDTIVPLPPFLGYINIMGQQFDPVLSAADRAGMAAVYGSGPALSSVVTNTLDCGPGSLRAALYYAYDHPGTTISFAIPATDSGYSNNVFNILPSDALPGLWGNTTIDGGTEPVQENPSGPQILLNGALGWALNVYPNGLRFRGTNSIARSLVINNFPGDGVLFSGVNVMGNTLAGCYVGIDPTGTMSVSNGYVPVEIDGGAISNLVGGTTVAARNVLSGSGYQGMSIHDAGTSFNVVEGNYIGLRADGMAALSNAWAGIQIFGGAQSNLIGGYTVAARNIISGNGYQGVAISEGAGGNIVAGNYLGLNPAGTAAISNGWSGVDIFGASSNSVGPSNVISGNGNYGVVISTPGTTGNQVWGNWIGLDGSGSMAVANQWAGVGIFGGAQSNVVGGLTEPQRNVISGNANQGVALGNAGASGNVVCGNYIGVNPAGTAALGNGWAGVNLFGGASGNMVGGNAPGAGNVIAGNIDQGMLLQDPGTSGNWVQGNLIGLDASGALAVSNGWAGVEIADGASGNLIGGYGSARNFISGNGIYGVYIDFGSGQNWVQGNTIGLDTANRVAIPNTYSGVAFYEASSNQVGGAFPGDANLISGNAGDGVEVLYSDSTNNSIRGNSIFGNSGTAILDYQGGNNDLAAPTVLSVVVTTNTVVSGNFPGAADEIYIFDFYADAPPVGSAQAQTYLGSVAIGGPGGVATFAVGLGVCLPAGRVVTATLTDPFGNTSALSDGVAATMTSTVNDGIPDAWRARYFGGNGRTTNSVSAALADPDHDGANNYAEFLAGTNPTNAASVLMLTALNPNTSTNVVSLNSVSGTVYRVLAADNLVAGNWSILADQVVGTGTNLLFYDAAAPAAPSRFYRAEVMW